ncbi:MAG: hypothetical protein GEV07_12730 [Streptosporangiales bacterium]|nr:hypothetical protein [Streptosporangiales bacterium]
MKMVLPLVIRLLSADPLPDEVGDKVGTLFSWLTQVLAWGAGIAFVVVGGVFCYAYFGGHGSSRAVRALAGVSAGCLLITVGAAIAGTLTGTDISDEE